MNGICVRLLVCFAIGGAPMGTFGAGLSRPCAGPQFRGGPEHRAAYCGDPARRVAGALWKFATGGPVESSPAVADEIVYFGSGDGAFTPPILDRTGDLAFRRGARWRPAGGRDEGLTSRAGTAGFRPSTGRRVATLERPFGDDLPSGAGSVSLLARPRRGPVYVGAGDGCVYRVGVADGVI
jgi:hypothetical protein